MFPSAEKSYDILYPMKKIRVSIPVWGERYVSLFLETALPALASPGNLGNLGGGGRDGFLSLHLITRPEDVRDLDAAEGIRELRRSLPVYVTVSRSADFVCGGYPAFNACYRDAMRDAYYDGAAVIPLTADQIWGDGSIMHVLGCAAQGAQAVMTAGLRVLDTAAPALKKILAASGTGVRSEDLARLALDHLHPWDRALVHDAHNKAQPASFQFWDAKGQGLLLRCLHLHPVYLELSRLPGTARQTIDASGLVREQCPDLSHVCVITHSDQAMHISFAPPEQSVHLIAYPRGDWRAMANWALTMGISRHNLWYMRHSIRIRSGEAGSAGWEEAEEQAAAFCDPLLAWLESPWKLWYSRLVRRMRANPTLSRFRWLKAIYRAFKKRLRLEY